METLLASRKGTADESGEQACGMTATESHRSSGAASAVTDACKSPDWGKLEGIVKPTGVTAW